jgi:transposase
MARRARVRFTPEFKAEALRRIRESDTPIRHIARDLGVSANTLHTWRKAARGVTSAPIAESEQEELVRLRRENQQLRTERDILKKATAFFARHSE